jgi:hypothetical protein
MIHKIRKYHQKLKRYVHGMPPDRLFSAVQCSSLLLAPASTVILGFGSRRDS